MSSTNRDKLKKIAELGKENIGKSEQNVKFKFIVALLKCFGHDDSDLDFEQDRTDISIKNIPEECRTIVETKSYDTNLDNINCIHQLEKYCRNLNVTIGVLANGEEIRIYTPFMIGKRFEESILCIVKRNELCEDNKVNLLEKYLSRDNLKSQKIHEHIREREEEIKSCTKKINELTHEIEHKIKSNNDVMNNLKTEKSSINSKIETLERENGDLRTQKLNQIQDLLNETQVPHPIVNDDTRSIANERFNPTLDTSTLNRGIQFDDVLNVLDWMVQRRRDYTDACKEVSKTRGITENTIRDACTRRLNINTGEFKSLIEDGQMENFLIKKYPRKTQEIKQVLKKTR